jgi:hypothetical protein
MKYADVAILRGHAWSSPSTTWQGLALVLAVTDR